MNTFDGHAAKRQRTDYDGTRQEGFNAGNNTFYNNKGGSRPPYEEKPPNHILLITVINPAYPITTDVIHTICSPSGKVLRIVIFKKNGVQAMVEFDNVESAERAKESLNGCDIYSGCCTLKIEFAKPVRLNVHKNDNESWDYTVNTFGKPPGASDRPALLQEPPRGYGPTGGAPGMYGGNDGRGHGPPGQAYGGYDDGYNGPRGGGGGQGRDPYGPPGRDPYGQPMPPEGYGREMYGREAPMQQRSGPGFGPGMQMPPPAGGNNQGVVMMAYGLNSKKMNAEKMFNLLCLYGNVIRVKYLKSKEGCAMIQMGDPLAVERAVSNLNGVVFFESKLQLGYSKQAYLNEVQQPFQLPDNTNSFRDFSECRNNRFMTLEAASKNRILPPSNVLHFFNAPVGFAEDDMKKVFEENEAVPPESVKVFASKQKTERSSSGLLEFSTVSEALEAIALCNHVQIPNPNGNFPFIFKLCFSSSRGPRGGGGGGGSNSGNNNGANQDPATF